jgi:flagellum-specific peptidoglycan hydrolase FlgJ
MENNPCYTAGSRISVQGLMLHSVGCAQPSASAFINSWNKASYDRACVHGFIDGNDGTVYQTLPWNYRGWHCGSSINGSANDTHIGVEMCEPGCITYVGGATIECNDYDEARAVAERTYNSAVELFAYLCGIFGLDPLADGTILSHSEGHSRGIASNHGDPEHLWNQLDMGYSMDTFRQAVADCMNSSDGDVTSDGEAQTTGTQASVFAGMSDDDVVATIGRLCRQNQTDTGILASISAAQFILESGYGRSELAQEANNCFGMKTSLSGNTWNGSAWDGNSVYIKETQEQNEDGSYETVTADFRKYTCVEDSIADHSAYLLGAKNGRSLRYKGIKGMTDYRAVAQLVKDGGYATSDTYVDRLCEIIEKWNLTRFDETEDTESPDSVTEFPDTPFTVKVIIDDLNYRSEPSMDGEVKGQTGEGVFTITEVSGGWGKLKSGAGWIWLENPSYCSVQASSAKSVDEIANEVIKGTWGNGDERREKLTAAGYDYDAVQSRVNELLK